MKIAAALHELLTENAAVRPDANEGILGVFQRGFTALLCRRPTFVELVSRIDAPVIQ